MNSHTFAPRRLLIAGCGSIGKRHMKNLCTLGEFDMIAFDPEPARRAEVKAMFGIETVDSLSCALKRKPEMCVIAAPTALHMPIAIQAARKGCHLFIEKPLSHSPEQIASLLELIKQ